MDERLMVDETNEDASGAAKQPFVCPVCGNDDLVKMKLIIVDKCWERYSYVEPTDDDAGKVPLFFYWTNDYAEADPDEPPMMMCSNILEREDGMARICTGKWAVDWDDFELG